MAVLMLLFLVSLNKHTLMMVLGHPHAPPSIFSWTLPWFLLSIILTWVSFLSIEVWLQVSPCL
ncbi:hypothetical protein MANES_02G017434v8 [Manihot esculenta]|uniref:Uncharacterized protein n=1 Tax=Manihot esculenta TaxID=3983 RepID=A0ACB7I4I7_MANES|nr:hypothetical protein MANES_02G017434v8 [Manihot esculenta]